MGHDIGHVCSQLYYIITTWCGHAVVHTCVSPPIPLPHHGLPLSIQQCRYHFIFFMMVSVDCLHAQTHTSRYMAHLVVNQIYDMDVQRGYSNRLRGHQRRRPARGVIWTRSGLVQLPQLNMATQQKGALANSSWQGVATNAFCPSSGSK